MNNFDSFADRNRSLNKLVKDKKKMATVLTWIKFDEKEKQNDKKLLAANKTLIEQNIKKWDEKY